MASSSALGSDEPPLPSALAQRLCVTLQRHATASADSGARATAVSKQALQALCSGLLNRGGRQKKVSLRLASRLPSACVVGPDLYPLDAVPHVLDQAGIVLDPREWEVVRRRLLGCPAPKASSAKPKETRNCKKDASAYATLTQHELVSTVCKRDDRIQKLELAARSLRKQRRVSARSHRQALERAKRPAIVFQN